MTRSFSIGHALVAVALLAYTSGAVASENTLDRYIHRANVDGRPATTHYFTAVAAPGATTQVGWGSTSCPNALYVYTRELEGQKDVLAAALAAAAMGKRVSFQGTCDADGVYFRATGIWVTY